MSDPAYYALTVHGVAVDGYVDQIREWMLTDERGHPFWSMGLGVNDLKACEEWAFPPGPITYDLVTPAEGRWGPYEGVKNWDPDDDIQRLSLAFPDALFRLYVEGPDFGDIWVLWAKNGKGYIDRAIIEMPRHFNPIFATKEMEEHEYRIARGGS